MLLRPLYILAVLYIAAATLPAHAETQIPGAAQPQLAATADGQIFLAYGQGRDVFVASSSDGGGTFTPAVKVATLPKLMLGMRRGPRIVAEGQRVTITVIAHELLAVSSKDSGKTWGQPVVINDVPASAREGLHDLAGTPGELFVTWLDLRNGMTELWGAISSDGGETWAKNQRVYKSPGKSICECCHPTARYDTGGNLAIMWRNSINGSRDMWMAIRARGEAKFAEARKLGEGTWTLNACPMDGGRIVPLEGGKFGAVFQRAGEVFAVLREGPEVSLGRGKQPVAVAGSDHAFVVWQNGADLFSNRATGGAAPTKCATDGRFPSLLALPNGKGTLLAYECGAKNAPSIAIERL